MQGKTLFSKDKIIRKIRKNITSTGTIPSFLYYICIRTFLRLIYIKRIKHIYASFI